MGISLGGPTDVHDSCFLVDDYIGGPDNGLGDPLTIAQMKQRASFSHWDFEKIWTICEGEDYPRLWWEGVVCQP